MENSASAFDLIVELLKRNDRYEAENRKLNISLINVTLDTWNEVLTYLESQQCKTCAEHLINEALKNKIFKI